MFGVPGAGEYKSCITLRTLDYGMGTMGIFLIMRHAGFISSTVLRSLRTLK